MSALRRNAEFGILRSKQDVSTNRVPPWQDKQTDGLRERFFSVAVAQFGGGNLRMGL